MMHNIKNYILNYIDEKLKIQDKRYVESFIIDDENETYIYPYIWIEQQKTNVGLIKIKFENQNLYIKCISNDNKRDSLQLSYKEITHENKKKILDMIQNNLF